MTKKLRPDSVKQARAVGGMPEFMVQPTAEGWNKILRNRPVGPPLNEPELRKALALLEQAEPSVSRTSEARRRRRLSG